MDPAAANDGGGIYNFAEIWNGLDSDPMALDQGPTYAPTNQNSKKRLEEDDLSIAAVGSNGNRENKGITEGNSGNSPDPPKQDFIHVRARRGQATDSHSLAERARREKISARMKTLRDLVPGCNRVVGKALVLDEIINYIQSLQRQVEFLSMKLEAVNARVEINGYPSKDS